MIETTRPGLQSEHPFPSIYLSGLVLAERPSKSVVCSSEVGGLGLELEFESGVCETPELVLFVLWNL